MKKGEDKTMFCYKCGIKLSDDAIFCHNCGTKVNTDTKISDSSPKTSELAENTQTMETACEKSSVDPNKYTQEEAIPKIQEIYNCLLVNASSCPKVKKISLKKVCMGSTIAIPTIKSTFFNYQCIPNKTPEKISVSMPKTLLNYLILYPCILCDGFFLNFLFQGEYFLPLTLCGIAGTVLWFLLTYFWCREQNEIIEYINKSVGCNIKLSNFPIIVSYILNVILIIVYIVVLILSII